MSQKEISKPIGSEQKKQIEITKIDTVAREDELVIKIEFRLLPSKTVFSKITSELFFDGQKMNTVYIRVPQSRLLVDDFELTPVLDMKGIGAGTHIIRVEMCELWSSGEKLACTSRQVTVEHVPQSKEHRLVKIPIVKSIAGTDLVIVSDSEKEIYHQMEENMKKELISERDEW
jgi:hypothetical protein